MTIAPPEKISDRYLLQDVIDKGAFGTVYEALDTHLRHRVAIKISTLPCITLSDDRMMAAEVSLYKQFAQRQYPGIPRMWDNGVQHGRAFVVLELMGPSLHTLTTYCGRIMHKSTLMIGMQLVQIVKVVHELGYLHRDLKPQNFVMGRGSRGNVVHLIDFGLATKVEKAERHAQHTLTRSLSSMQNSYRSTPPRIGLEKSLTGTPAFVAVHTHTSNVHTRVTDLEQLCYAMSYCANGKLPWTLDAKKAALYKYKTTMTARQIMGDAPGAFLGLLMYARHRPIVPEPPEYDKFMKMLEEEFEECGYKKDFQYDWFDVNERLRCNPHLSHREVLDQRLEQSEAAGLGQSWLSRSSRSWRLLNSSPHAHSRGTSARSGPRTERGSSEADTHGSGASPRGQSPPGYATISTPRKHR